ncbi:MAG: protein kinase [Flavobacterium sp.]
MDKELPTENIKPGNILFDNNWSAKLSDFGLAYGLSHQAFNFAGYSSHLAPEVIEGTAQDELSDHYSMGVTFHRLLNNMHTLDLPFADDTQWLKAVKKEKYPPRIYKHHIPEQVIRVVKKSMKADRGSRFQTCLEFRQALQKISLAIEWKPVHRDHWSGKYNGDIYEIELYEKRTGYFIDFKKNSRKINDRSYAQIPDENTAKDEFFKVIRETTLAI